MVVQNLTKANSKPEVKPIGISGELRIGDIEFINGVLYGPPGSGKTYLLGSASKCPELQPALVITLDHMDPTLSKFDRENLHVLDVPSQAKKANKTITNYMDSEILKHLRTTKYKFVGFDSVSKLLNPFVYREVLKEGIKIAQEHGRKHDPELLEQQDYQRATVRIYSWMEEMRGYSIDRGFHFFVVAREREEYIETAEFQGDFYYPDMPPELRRLVLHEFDFCYRLKVSSKVTRTEGQQKSERVQIRRLYTIPRVSLVVKDRLGGLGDNSENPSAKTIIDSGIKAMHSPKGV